MLFLNPDAAIAPADVRALAEALSRDPGLVAVGPRLVDDDGRLTHSIRRFPTIGSLVGQALFLHRLPGAAGWADEIVGDEGRYLRADDADWISGACLMVRREALERLGGWDEGFFLYSEDVDLCKRIWASGGRVGFSPDATCRHEGGRSAPRSGLMTAHVASRLRYARKHGGRGAAALERVGLCVWALTHAAAGRGGRVARAGYLRAFGRMLRPRPRMTP